MANRLCGASPITYQPLRQRIWVLIEAKLSPH
jgi:hypothetical protein